MASRKTNKRLRKHSSLPRSRVFAKTNICLFLQLYMRRLSEHKYLCFGGLRRRRFKFGFHFCLPGLIDLRRERLRKILTSFGEKGVIESHTFEGSKSVTPSIYGEQVNIRSPVYNQSSPIRGSGANTTQEINNISNNCTKEGLCGVQTGEFDLSLVLR